MSARTRGSAALLSKNDKAPKDLINLINRRNGEEYRFACRTCIDGHRAPLCDPKKHRGKILFRRPSPGRPARQCGHPKNLQCDCSAKRTLCCVLTNEEWDQVEAGEVVTVDMFDTKEDLENYQRSTMMANAAAFPPAPPAMMLMQMHNQFQEFTQQHQMSMPLRPHMGDIANHPDDNMIAQQDAFPSWNVPVMPPQQVQAGYPLHYGSGMPTPQSYLTAPPTWPAPRPEYLNYNSSHMAAGTAAAYEDASIPQPHFDPQADMYTSASAPLLSPTPMDPDLFPDLKSNINTVPQYSFDTQQQIAAQPSHEPTQSCCSSKSRQQPRPMQTFHSYNFPRSEPTSQFPCARCASSDCTCLTCPEVRQIPEKNGAWAAQCGRGGHMTSNFFMPPQTPMAPLGTVLAGPSSAATPQVSAPQQVMLQSQQPQSEISLPPDEQFEDFVDVAAPEAGHYVDPSLLDTGLSWPTQHHV